MTVWLIGVVFKLGGTTRKANCQFSYVCLVYCGLHGVLWKSLSQLNQSPDR